MLAAISVDARELRQRDREADQQDHGVDEAAHEAQPRRGLAATRRRARASSPAAPRAAGTRDRRRRRARSASAIVTTAEIHSSFSRQNSSIVPRVIGVPERTRAVLLDALGTLVHFEPPAPLLRAALRERLGIEVSEEVAEAAIRDEIAYYRAHLHEGRDAASLADLRRRSAEAMRPALGVDADLTDVLLASLRFHAYPGRRAGAARPCARAASRSWWCPTGTTRCTSAWPRPGSRRWSTARSPPPSSATPSRTRAIFEHALELAGADAGRGAARRRLAERGRGGRAGRRAAGGARRARRDARRTPAFRSSPRSPSCPLTLEGADDERPAHLPAPRVAAVAARAAGGRARSGRTPKRAARWASRRGRRSLVVLAAFLLVLIAQVLVVIGVELAGGDIDGVDRVRRGDDRLHRRARRRAGRLHGGGRRLAEQQSPDAGLLRPAHARVAPGAGLDAGRPTRVLGRARSSSGSPSASPRSRTSSSTSRPRTRWSSWPASP